MEEFDEPKTVRYECVLAQERQFDDDDEIVLLENDEVTRKRVFYKDGDMILQPENDAYEPIVVPLKDVMDRRVQILGRLVHNKIRY